ncbi:hypothetical protein [Pseudomonas saudiphocaensis]|jgi:hypothetical protein|uniref:hypothetical protein n=1 Tax=Pseudomonas saudiphocaensis TaxID=1499686 RepID=UPI000F768B7D|nr:hypothetical protein [Pseudomonas saudiphocaensis]MBE7928790.1 hypothetical protein [Pseudomonas saudiphocaensis]RRV14628.1 hypothetical protein EGJ00_13410 [Pseudomonas saudiphocaensis]
MKLEMARGLFLVGALGVVTLCAVAWSEPDARVVARGDLAGYCPVPRLIQASPVETRPDHDLLLFIYSMSQSLVGRG